MSALREYMHAQEWSMGNGQCPVCQGCGPVFENFPDFFKDRRGHRDGCKMAVALAELDATAAPVVVGEDAAILKAVQHSDAGLALAYMIRDDVKLGDFRDAIVGAVRAGTAALAGD